VQVRQLLLHPCASPSVVLGRERVSAAEQFVLLDEVTGWSFVFSSHSHGKTVAFLVISLMGISQNFHILTFLKQNQQNFRLVCLAPKQL